MAADDPVDPMPPPHERLFASEELRPLEEFPRPLVAHLQSRSDLRYHLTAIRRHFLELREAAKQRLTPTLGGIVIGSPDHMDKVEEWRAEVNRGEVPAEFGGMKLLQARELLADHFFYGEILGLVKLTLEHALWRALPGAGLVGTGENQSAPSIPWSERRPVDLAPDELIHVLRLSEAATDMGRAITGILGAFQLVLSLLTNMAPADLIRGRATVVNARAAASSEKHARGIQAATAEVYRAGMTEQECWDALREVDGELLTAEGIDYEFFLDRAGEKVAAACQRVDRTGDERSIKRGSFRPYFVRARSTYPPP